MAAMATDQKKAAAIASGAQAPFRLCKTVLTSFSSFEADPTYVMHMAVSASTATVASTPKPSNNSAASASAAAAAAAPKATTSCCIAAATSDHVVKLYDYNLQTGALTLMHQLGSHKTTIHDVQFVPGTNNSLLCSASEDGTVVMWDARTAKPAAAPFSASNTPFFSCSVSGHMLAAGTTAACLLWYRAFARFLSVFVFRFPFASHASALRCCCGQGYSIRQTHAHPRFPHRRRDAGMNTRARASVLCSAVSGVCVLDWIE
jgi:hypothetical protein